MQILANSPEYDPQFQYILDAIGDVQDTLDCNHELASIITSYFLDAAWIVSNERYLHLCYVNYLVEILKTHWRLKLYVGQINKLHRLKREKNSFAWFKAHMALLDLSKTLIQAFVNSKQPII